MSLNFFDIIFELNVIDFLILRKLVVLDDFYQTTHKSIKPVNIFCLFCMLKHIVGILSVNRKYKNHFFFKLKIIVRYRILY